jgi:hypothetical protein
MYCCGMFMVQFLGLSSDEVTTTAV